MIKILKKFIIASVIISSFLTSQLMAAERQDERDCGSSAGKYALVATSVAVLGELQHIMELMLWWALPSTLITHIR